MGGDEKSTHKVKGLEPAFVEEDERGVEKRKNAMGKMTEKMTSKMMMMMKMKMKMKNTTTTTTTTTTMMRKARNGWANLLSNGLLYTTRNPISVAPL